MIEFWPDEGFPQKIYQEDYIKNGIRVMKKYLLKFVIYNSKHYIYLINNDISFIRKSKL